MVPAEEELPRGHLHAGDILEAELARGRLLPETGVDQNDTSFLRVDPEGAEVTKRAATRTRTKARRKRITISKFRARDGPFPSGGT